MKYTLLVTYLVLVVIHFGCKDNPTTSAGGAVGSVSLKLGTAPAGIVRVVATFSRSGFDTRSLTLAVNDTSNSATGSVQDLPVGLWHLEVDAFNDSGAVKYSGQTDVDVIGGNVTQVSLELSATTGDVDILVTWGGQCVSSPAGLVSWWPGDGDARDIIGGNDGYPVDSVTFRLGMVGRAFSFSRRGEYIRIPFSPMLNPDGGSFTLDAWIRPMADVPHAGIISKWGDRGMWAGQRSWYLGVGAGGTIEFSVCDSAHQLDSTFQIFRSAPGKIRLGAWSHVAAVFDQDLYMRRAYVNGVKIMERIDAPFAIMQGVADVSIGAFLGAPNFGDYFFPGQIDEADFFDRALTGEEIAAIFAAGSHGKCK